LLGSWRMSWSGAAMTSVSFIVCQSRVLHAMFVRGAFYRRTADVNTCSGLSSGSDMGRMDGWPKEAASSQSLSISPKAPIPSDAQCRQKSFLGDVMGSFIIHTRQQRYVFAQLKLPYWGCASGTSLQNPYFRIGTAPTCISRRDQRTSNAPLACLEHGFMSRCVWDMNLCSGDMPLTTR
jgi:hypothetical protein